MARKKLAVAVIHGIGSQGEAKPPSTDKLVFSGDLRDRIAGELGRPAFDKRIAWREIFWSDVLQDRQNRYLTKIKPLTRGDKLRSFLLCNIADASAYRLTGDKNNTTYTDIHARVEETVRDLEGDVEEGAPLVVLAHSLGAHIMSNYIYDMQKAREYEAEGLLATTPFQQLRTMAGFVTFGCNIPLFTFAYQKDKIKPIDYPGVGIPEDARLAPWWLNFYDQDDILGYPLEFIGPKYKELVTGEQLAETSINAGGLEAFWNPLSHNGYWKDDDFYKPAAQFLAQFL